MIQLIIETYSAIEVRAAELATTSVEVRQIAKRYEHNMNAINKWIYVGGEFPDLSK